MILKIETSTKIALLLDNFLYIFGITVLFRSHKECWSKNVSFIVTFRIDLNHDRKGKDWECVQYVSVKKLQNFSTAVIVIISAYQKALT